MNETELYKELGKLTKDKDRWRTPVTNWTGQKKKQSDALAAHFGELLFFALFVLMK